MTKPTLILQNSVIRIRLMKWLLLPFLIFTCLNILDTIVRQWIKNDFVFSFDLFLLLLPDVFLVFYGTYLIYLGYIFIRERLVLDHTGIHYCSGQSLWKTILNNDWHFHWENIQYISVVQTNGSHNAQLRFIVQQSEQQEYETPIFKWVDTETLDTAHTKSIYKYKLFGFEFMNRNAITAEEFHESVLRTPIYQYLAQYHKQPIRIIPKEDQHIYNPTNDLLFSFVLLIILLVLFPWLLMYLVS